MYTRYRLVANLFYSIPPEAPAIVASFRRPATNESSKFWYISQDAWDKLVTRSCNASKRKVALNNLRKFNAAGRIMETDEGIIAPTPCRWCTKDDDHECKVWRGRADLACAYCKRHAKKGCKAKLVEEEEEEEQELEEAVEENGSLAARFEVLAGRLDGLQQENTLLRREVCFLREEVDLVNMTIPRQHTLNKAMDRYIQDLYRDMGVIWNHLFKAAPVAELPAAASMQ